MLTVKTSNRLLWAHMGARGPSIVQVIVGGLYALKKIISILQGLWVRLVRFPFLQVIEYEKLFHFNASRRGLELEAACLSLSLSLSHTHTRACAHTHTLSVISNNSGIILIQSTHCCDIIPAYGPHC